MERYEVCETVGEGTYGVVLKCRDRTEDRVVAVKRFKHFNSNAYVRRTMVRELRALQLLCGDPFVVRLIEAFMEDGTLHLVMDYVKLNLLDVLDRFPSGLCRESVRRLMFTLLLGVRSCHRSGVLHRDIKPENILVDEADGTATLCDFGFSRPKCSGGVGGRRKFVFVEGFTVDDASDDAELITMTNYVATRWYRSPEMLLGFSQYGLSVDMWAVGAIMAEACDGQPLLPGKTEVDQIALIERRIGPMPPHYLQRCQRSDITLLTAAQQVPPSEYHFLTERFQPCVGAEGVDLMRRLLAIDCDQRINVEDALQHSFFEGLADELDPGAEGYASNIEEDVRQFSAVPSSESVQSNASHCCVVAEDTVDLSGRAVSDDSSRRAHWRSVEEAGLLELSINSSPSEAEKLTISHSRVEHAPPPAEGVDEKEGAQLVKSLTEGMASGLSLEEHAVAEMHIIGDELHKPSAATNVWSDSVPSEGDGGSAPMRTLLFRSRRSLSPKLAQTPDCLHEGGGLLSSTQNSEDAGPSPASSLEMPRPTPPLLRIRELHQQNHSGSSSFHGAFGTAHSHLITRDGVRGSVASHDANTFATPRGSVEGSRELLQSSQRALGQRRLSALQEGAEVCGDASKGGSASLLRYDGSPHPYPSSQSSLALGSGAIAVPDMTGGAFLDTTRVNSRKPRLVLRE